MEHDRQWTSRDVAAGRSGPGPSRRTIDEPAGGRISHRSGSTRSPALVAESEIVDAVLDGNRDAFRALVDREGPAVVRACHRILGDIGAAEDVAQEAFVIAYRSLGTWRAEGPFGAWLMRIAVRLAIRQAGRRKVLTWISPTLSADGATDDPVARLRSDSSTEPERLILRGERQGAVRRAVAALDEPYREVVALRFFGERSLDEIATLTGRPIGTVKTHLHRGLLRLRTALGGAEG